MTSRVLVGAAAGWLSLYYLAYVLLVHAQEGAVARWYVALGLLALLTCVAGVAGVAPSVTTLSALVLTAAATLAGVLSIGLLLAPAVFALSVAVLRRPAMIERPSPDEVIDQTPR